MKSEREREAKEFRATGEEEAQKIRADAEKTRTVIVAEAQGKRKKIGVVETVRLSKYMQTALEKMQISFHFIGLWKPTVLYWRIELLWCYPQILNF